MKKRGLMLAILSFLTVTIAPVQAWGTAKHVEKDGLLEIEAEDMQLRRPWKMMTDAKASGGKYMLYASKDNYRNATSGKGSVKFQITTPGRYRFQFTIRQPNNADGDKANDCWVDFSGVDPIDSTGQKIDGPMKVFGRGKGEFKTCGSYDVHGHNPSKGKLYVKFDKPGVYTLELAGRSGLFQLDKIVLKLENSDNVAKKGKKNKKSKKGRKKR